MINSFSGEYRFLSNFWPAKVKFDGQEYPTVEHAYQAAKTLKEEERYIIRIQNTAGQAKRCGAEVTLRSDWRYIKVGVMEYLLTQKFSAESPELLNLLLKTGDHELVEGNTWGDTFWGVCEGKGKNMLGILLMDIRKIYN